MGQHARTPFTPYSIVVCIVIDLPILSILLLAEKASSCRKRWDIRGGAVLRMVRERTFPPFLNVGLKRNPTALFDNPAISLRRPVALRPRLTAGLPFSQRSRKKRRVRYFDHDNK